MPEAPAGKCRKGCGNVCLPAQVLPDLRLGLPDAGEDIDTADIDAWAETLKSMSVAASSARVAPKAKGKALGKPKRKGTTIQRKASYR